MNVVADYFYRARGAGHTRLLIRSIAHHLMETGERIVVFVGSMREADDIRKGVRDTLLNDVRKVSYAVKATERIVFVSARERNQDSKICGRRVPALVDNAAVMEITEGYQRQLGAMANSIEDRDAKIQKLEADLANAKAERDQMGRTLFSLIPLCVAAKKYTEAFWEHQRYEQSLDARDRVVDDLSDEESERNHDLWMKSRNARSDLAKAARGPAPVGLKEPEE